MKQPRIILLDLGGVVFQSSGTSNQIIDWKVINDLNHKYGYDLNIGRTLLQSLLNEYNELTNQYLTDKEFLKEVFDTLEINSELINLLNQQSEIIIVSDNYRENINYISQRYDFDKWSIKQIYSFEYEMLKEDPKFFARLLEDLKEFKREEMLFIDDSPNKIDSARKCGIKGIVYKINKQIRQELNEYS